MEAVYLSRNDVANLQRKLIGKGTDGSVYDVGHGYLYKIYHDGSAFSDIDVAHPLLDGYEDDVKIYQKGKSYLYRNHNFCFKYTDINDVRISAQDSIYLAIQRQKDIQYTRLPLAPIYVNSRFKGCVLKKHAFHCQFHSFSFLPEEQRRKLLLLVTERVEEIVRHYIYPLDIWNRPCEKKLSHSNILLSLLGVPELIDMDGKSTIYTEKEDFSLLQNVLRGLNILVLEFLYNIDLSDEMTDEDVSLLEQFLFYKGLSDNYVDKLVYQEADFSTLRKVLKR